MSNFLFLQKNRPGIYKEATDAEALTFSSHKACAMMCRSAIEKAVRWLYVNDQSLLGMFDEADAYKVISILEGINQNAGAA